MIFLLIEYYLDGSAHTNWEVSERERGMLIGLVRKNCMEQSIFHSVLPLVVKLLSELDFYERTVWSGISTT